MPGRPSPPPSPTPVRSALSRAAGWAADLRVPRPLRRAVFGAYCRATGADPTEAQLPLEAYPSLGAFFVRRLHPGARPIAGAPDALASPCDGLVLTVGTVEEGRALQAKGRPYRASDLVGGAMDDAELEGATAWTIYLSPRDYHRVHAPEAAELVEVRWILGGRHSVAPKVVAGRDRVLVENERACLRLETAHGPLLVVMVGALNVGRIRVVGVPYGASPTPEAPRRLERGAELARFEMGSTVVLLAPGGRAAARDDLAPGRAVRLGEPIGRWTGGAAAAGAPGPRSG